MKKILLRLVFFGTVAGGSIRGMRKLTGWNMLEEYLGDISTIEVSGDEKKSQEVLIDADPEIINTGVLVVSPKFITQDELSEKTYVGTIYSPYYGQVYAFREGIIEKLYVDVGDTVKKGQSLGKLTAQTFAPELADMQASRQADITSSQGEVRGAKLQLDYAIQAKQTYMATLSGVDLSVGATSSTDEYLAQLDSEMTAKAKEVLLKVRTLESDITIIDQTIELEKQKMETEKQGLLAEITAIEKQIEAGQQNIGTSLRFAYNQLLSIFYDGNFNQVNNVRPNNFGATNTSTVRDFQDAFRQLIGPMTEIENASIQTQEEVKGLLLIALDKGIRVLDNTTTSETYNYTEQDLINDRQALVNAKINDNAGLATVGTEITLSNIQIQNKQAQIDQLLSAQEVQLKNLELSKQQKLQEIESLRQGAENELVFQQTDILEKKRELELQAREQELQQLEINNQKRDRERAIQEYDKDIADAQAGVAMAEAKLAGAKQALGILQQGGYNNSITAPFNGTITKRFLTVGQTVSAETPIFDLVDSSKGEEKFVRFDVPEAEFDGLNMGQQIKFLRVQDPVRHYTATISRIANAIDEETKSILVEAQLQDDNEKILIGSTVVVMFEQSGDTSLVPITAVIEDETGDLIIRKVVDDIIVGQTVETGKTIGDQLYITSGLNAGDLIVSDATQVKGKETGDSISVVKGFQASEIDQGLDALGDGHDHEH